MCHCYFDIKKSDRYPKMVVIWTAFTQSRQYITKMQHNFRSEVNCGALEVEEKEEHSEVPGKLPCKEE